MTSPSERPGGRNTEHLSLPPLYALVGRLGEITQQLMDQGGEVTDELQEALQATEGALEQKVENIVHVVRTLETQAAGVKLERQRLEALELTRTRAAEWLKGYLKAQLEIAGVQRVDTPTARVRIQANSQPVIRWTLDPVAIPELFRVTTYALDGRGAQEALKTRGVLPVGFSVERHTHLRIS